MNKTTTITILLNFESARQLKECIIFLQFFTTTPLKKVERTDENGYTQKRKREVLREVAVLKNLSKFTGRGICVGITFYKNRLI